MHSLLWAVAAVWFADLQDYIFVKLDGTNLDTLWEVFLVDCLIRLYIRRWVVFFAFHAEAISNYSHLSPWLHMRFMSSTAIPTTMSSFTHNDAHEGESHFPCIDAHVVFSPMIYHKYHYLFRWHTFLHTYRHSIQPINLRKYFHLLKWYLSAMLFVCSSLKYKI